jgi:hypothetical protein
MSRPIVIRCAVPDCEWGFLTTGLGDMSRCYRAYGRHCVEVHQADAESLIHFDLQTLMLSVKR